MAFALQPGSPMAEDFRRIASEEVASALALLASAHPDESAVHEVRKHMKKMRGLMRLLRRPLGPAYDQGNILCREVGRSLSGVRDADVMLETLGWVRMSGRPMDAALLRQCQEALERHRQGLRGQADKLQEKVGLARQHLRAMEQQTAGWSLPEDRSGLVRDGLQRLYRRARGFYQLSMTQPTDEHFHEWRKRVKYHWYHCRLLEPLAPGFLGGRERRLKSLSDIIGREHDLAVLRNFLSASACDLHPLQMLEVQEVLAILQNQQREQAWRLGGELFAQPAGYWTGQCMKACGLGS